MSEKTFRSGSTSYYSIWKIPQCASFMKIEQSYKGRKDFVPQISFDHNSGNFPTTEVVHAFQSMQLVKESRHMFTASKPTSLRTEFCESATFSAFQPAILPLVSALLSTVHCSCHMQASSIALFAATTLPLPPLQHTQRGEFVLNLQCPRSLVSSVERSETQPSWTAALYKSK